MTATVSNRPTRPLRLALAALGLALAGPADAVSLAELEVTEYSRGSPGASVALGYFNPGDTDLVTSSKIVTPINDGSGDVFTKYFYRYRDSERVNAGHGSGVAVLGTPAPGHSYAKAFGYADAGVDIDGGYTNMAGYAYALAGEHPSTGYAITTMEILFTWVVGPGDSGAAVGEPVTGLRWELGADGFLDVSGITWPNRTNSLATMEFSARIDRGPGGLCGSFACPTNTRAASIDAYAALQAYSRAPTLDDDSTGLVRRYRDWEAWSNADGSWGEPGAWVVAEAPTAEDAPMSRGIGVDTRDGLGYIDFDATVGETLKLTATLDIDAVVDGAGSAEADFWGSMATRIHDPLGRGYSLSFAVSPIPEPANWLFLLAGLAILGMRGRAPRQP